VGMGREWVKTKTRAEDLQVWSSAVTIIVGMEWEYVKDLGGDGKSKVSRATFYCESVT